MKRSLKNIWFYCLCLCLPFIQIFAQLTYEDSKMGSYAYQLTVNEKDEVFVSGIRSAAPDYKFIPFISKFNAQLELIEEQELSIKSDSYIEQTTINILPNDELLFSMIYWDAQESLWHWKWIKFDQELNEIEAGGKQFGDGSFTYVSRFSFYYSEEESYCIWRINDSNGYYWEVYFLDENLNEKDSWTFVDFEGYESLLVTSMVKDNFGEGYILIGNSLEDGEVVSPFFRIKDEGNVELLDVLPLRVNEIAQGSQSKWYMVGSQKDPQDASVTEAMLLIFQQDFESVGTFKFSSKEKNIRAFNEILITENDRIFIAGTDGWGGGEGPVSSVTKMEVDEFGIVLWEAEKNFSGEGDMIFDLKEDAASKHLISCGIANSSDVIGVENYFVWSEAIPVSTALNPEIVEPSILSTTNPFHDELNLSFSNEHKPKWKIMDVNGRQFFSSKSFNGISIDTHAWPAGIYLMQFEDNPKSPIKLLKQ